MNIVQQSRSLKQRLGALALILVVGTANLNAAPQRMSITFAGYAGGRTALTDFPVLVVLSNNVGESGFNYSHFLREDGYDLRFKANPGDTVNLNYEIEAWDTNGTSFVWVQAPTLPGDGSGTLWALWGRESEQLACTTNGAVWSGGYRSVWHLGLTNGVTDLADWTPNRRYGVNYGTVSAAGKIGQGRDFERDNKHYIDVPTGLGSIYIPTANAPITLSCWFKAESITTANMDHRLINTHDATDSTAIALGLGLSNKLQMNIDGRDVGGANITVSSLTSLSVGQWYHGAVSFDGNVGILYLNGVEVGRTEVGAKLNPGAALAAKLGRLSPTANYFDGVLDEARISSVARSADWLWACHGNQASNAVFNAFGAMEPDEPHLPRIENVVLCSRADTSADVVGRLITNGTTAATVNLYWSTADGTMNAATWIAAGGVTVAGSYADGATFTNAIGPLTPNTLYYWNHNAVNASGTVWAATAGSPSFKTFGPPAVDNGVGATSIGVSTVTLNGALTNGGPANVFFDWWADGGNVTNRIDLGDPRELGGFSTNLTGLVPSTAYRYRAFASNVYGTAVAETSNFTTLALVTTSGDVTWSGAGAVPFWDVPANWAGNAAPTNPTTASVIYTDDGQSVTGVLDASRRIGKLSIGEVAADHTINLAGHTLTLEGDLDSKMRGTLGFRNGTLKIGSDVVWGDVLLDCNNSYQNSTIVRMEPGAVFDSYRIDTVRIGLINHINDGNGRLDLRGAVVKDVVLRANTLRIAAHPRGHGASYLALDDATSIDALVVSNELTIGEGTYGGTSYIGNPDDAGLRLPPGIDIQVGSDPDQRASLQIGKNPVNSGASAGPALDARLAATSGGTFTAYLSSLKIVPYESSYSANNPMNGLLDLAGMDLCNVDAQTILVAPNDSANASAQPRGTVRLPPGTVRAGTVVIGATAGDGFGLIEMSNTVFTVTNTLTIAKTGDIVVRVGNTSSGVDILRSDADAIAVDAAATLTLRFLEAPVAKPHYGLRWAGDHTGEVEAMLGSRLLVDSSGLAKPAEVFLFRGATFIGVKPSGGTAVFIQ